MPGRFTANALLVTTLALCAAVFITDCSRQPNHSQLTGEARQVGAYRVAIRVGPPATIVDSAEAAKSRQGQTIIRLSGNPSAHKGMHADASHYVGVFITKHGSPVKNARLRVRYKKKGSSRLHKLPVSLMKTANPGDPDVHYGSNAKIKPGQYVFIVTINNRKRARINLEVK